MFENLKETINRQNLKVIKKKNRYLEEQINQSISKSLSKNDKNKNYPNQKYVERQKPQQNKYQNQDDSQQDSLSDYQLQQREQVFKQLIKQNEHQFSPLQKKCLNFSQKQFSPQNKIKQLQKSVSISQEKLKLTQEYHQRQIGSLKQKYQHKIHQINIQVQKLKLIIHNHDSKEQRINQLLKQNKGLKDTLCFYQEKVWKLQNIQAQYLKIQSENKIIKTQNLQFKSIVQNLKIAQHYEKDKVSETERRKSHDQNQLQNKIKLQQRTIQNLNKKVNDLQRQSEFDKSLFEERASSSQMKISRLEQMIEFQQKQLKSCRIQVQRLRTEKQKIERSLISTMESFSKHLSNESSQNNYALVSYLNKSSNKQNLIEKRMISKSFENKERDERTLNLDCQEEPLKIKNKIEEKYEQLNQISPVSAKNNHHFEQDQLTILNKNKYERMDKRREKYGSQNKVNKSYKDMRRPVYENYKYDPQKDEIRYIQRLQKKLQIANKKIVQLLRQKIVRS